MSSLSEKTWLKIEFSDFKGYEFEERFVRATLRTLLDIAPSRSSFKLELQYRNDVFCGILTVKSSEKKFKSTCFDRDFYGLIKKIKRDMNWQFESWKQTRFINAAM